MIKVHNIMFLAVHTNVHCFQDRDFRNSRIPFTNHFYSLSIKSGSTTNSCTKRSSHIFHGLRNAVLRRKVPASPSQKIFTLIMLSPLSTKLFTSQVARSPPLA